jgi:hypothetical protein
MMSWMGGACSARGDEKCVSAYKIIVAKPEAEETILNIQA